MKLPGRAAQMHVLEVLLVATLFTSAVNVAVISLPASDATRVGDDNLRYQGMQLLQVLDEWQTGAGESTLATWLSEDNSSALLSYLDGGLPAAASYRLMGAHGGSSETLVERGTKPFIIVSLIGAGAMTVTTAIEWPLLPWVSVAALVMMPSQVAREGILLSRTSVRKVPIRSPTLIPHRILLI